MKEANSHITTAQTPAGNYRWTICALIFFATTINYLDRAVISLLKADLEKVFNWSEEDYANIVIAFQVSYAIGLLAAGRLIDKIGTRVGYGISIALWSIACAAHALVTGTAGFMAARSFLGITEAGNFPSAIKTVAEWFPKKERALATGIFNSGANMGAVLAPLIVPLIAGLYGWQWAFIATGAMGFVWLIIWWLVYKLPHQHQRISQSEYNYIHSDREEQTEAAESRSKLSWWRLLTFRQTWAYVLGKFLTDPIWWFYLFWLPAFLKAQYGLVGTAVSLPVACVYVMAAIGSIGGGWLPLRFIKKDWTVFRARKTCMLLYALCALPVMTAQYFGSINIWLAVIIIGFAASAHQAWSANIYTTVSDAFPKAAVASVTGIGGMAGASGGILIAALAGKLFEHYKALGTLETGYFIMFFICGLAYIVAWLLMHLLVPVMKPIEV